MELIFWLTVFLISASCFGYPLILLLLARFFGKEPKKAEITPFVSLFIPAYNEEKVIASKLENSLSLDYPKDRLEIIVASESNDKTNEIVQDYKDKGVTLFAYQEREGKSALIYKTFPHLRGEIVVLTDANIILNEESIKKLVRNFVAPEIGCVSGYLKFFHSKNLLIGQSKGLLRQYWTLIRKLESKIQSVLGADGSLFALRKECYFPLSKERGDDFELAIRVKQKGKGVLFEPEAIAFEESLRSGSQEFRRRIRITSWQLKSIIILLKESLRLFQPILVVQLIFKILKWLFPTLLILFFLSNIFLLKNAFYKLTMLSQIAFYAIALFSWQQDKQNKKINLIFNLIYFFCLTNLATLIGLIKGVWGRQKAFWEKLR